MDQAREDDFDDTTTVVKAAEMLGLHRATVVELVKRSVLKGYKKTPTRTSAFVVDRDSVLDFDRRRREQAGQAY